MRAQTMPGNGSNVGLGREFTTLGVCALKSAPRREIWAVPQPLCPYSELSEPPDPARGFVLYDSL